MNCSAFSLLIGPEASGSITYSPMSSFHKVGFVRMKSSMS